MPEFLLVFNILQNIYMYILNIKLTEKNYKYIFIFSSGIILIKINRNTSQSQWNARDLWFHINYLY